MSYGEYSETATSWRVTELLPSIGCVGILCESLIVRYLSFYPSGPSFDWLHGADPTSTELTLEDLRREPAAYLLPARDLEADLEKQLKRLCKTIFEEQLDGWYRVKKLWPQDRSVLAFREWFERVEQRAHVSGAVDRPNLY